jgi:hypothetical protein
VARVFGGGSTPIRNVEGYEPVKNISTRTDPIFLAAVLVISLGLTSNASAQQPLLPNLTAMPAFDITAELNFAGDPELRFAFSSWNSGDGPMELIAGEISQGRQNVYQRIYNDDDSFADALAGNFEWHQGHNHFHFDDYALYVLPAIQGNSQRTSQKTSFCLMDTNLIDGSLPGAPPVAEYANCGNFFQGISVGWGDTYGSNLPGQEISLKKLKDGDYHLITQADPENRIQETDETDNQSCVLLHIVVSTPTPTVEILNANDCGPPPPDADGDGLQDSLDNCPNVQNTAEYPDSEGWAPQQDDDLDGIGNACDLVVTTTSLPSSRAGKPYSQQLTSLRGTPPFTWTLFDPGNFSPDFDLSSAGVVSGETQSVAMKSFTVQVMDSTGDTAIQPLSISITLPNCMSCHSAAAF